MRTVDTTIYYSDPSILTKAEVSLPEGFAREILEILSDPSRQGELDYVNIEMGEYGLICLPRDCREFTKAAIEKALKELDSAPQELTLEEASRQRDSATKHDPQFFGDVSLTG